MKSLPEEPPKRTKASQPSAIRYYLVIYNLISAVGWSYVFFTTTAHIAGLTALSRVTSTHAPTTATSAFMRILSSIPYLKSSAPISAQVQARIPPALVPLFNRAITTFAAVGAQTALVQSFAALDIAHSLLGLVRSPIMTTVMQVASRLIMVWGIAEKYESARDNPVYASMVISWSITEIIRYSFYAGNLLQYDLRWLLWLRYNTFFVLYPLGAGSEAAVIFSTLPSSNPFQTGSWTQKAWSVWDYGRAILFLSWWPSLYVLYIHMIQQRKKVLGAGRTVGSKSKVA